MGRGAGRLRPQMISIAASACALADVPERITEQYQQWLASGMNAGMDYMANHGDIRQHAELLLPGARSIISFAIPFPIPGGGRESGAIASYALGRDYHDEIRNLFKPALKQLESEGVGEWRLCVDSAPVMERYWAVATGLGKPTMSGMVAVDRFGTACFLFELLTTATLEELGLKGCMPLTRSDFARLFQIESDGDNLIPGNTRPPECTHCGACVSACPGRALSAHSNVETGCGIVDARRCLSYLTIEHKGEFETPEAIEVINTDAGRRTLFGCDRCVTVCPLNGEPYRDSGTLSFMPGLLPNPGVASLGRADIIGMNQEEFSRIFKGSAIKRAKLAGLRRNAQQADLLK